MSEEFKNEEEQKFSAEQNPAAGQEAQGAAESPAAREIREQTTTSTTYSWVNPKISGRQEEENNSAFYTGSQDQEKRAHAEPASGSAGEKAESHTGNPYRNGGGTSHYEYQAYQPKTEQVAVPEDHRRKQKKEKKPMTTGKKWGMTLAMAACFGLVAGTVFTGTAAVGQQLFGSGTPVTSVTIPTTTAVNTGTPTGAASGMSVKDVAASAMPSLVAISTVTVEEVQTFFGTTSQEVPASGTGVIVGQNDDELLIATNNHVVSGAQKLSVSFIDDQTVEGQIKGTDADNDLAVVAVKLSDIPEDTLGQIKVAVMGDSDEMEVGDQVVAIGNALGTGQSVTSGYVSAKDRDITSQDEATGERTTSEGLIQTDAAINPGNSGGALLDMKGELIGINEAKYSSTEVEGMGYAIPIAKAKPILQDLMNLTTRYKVDDAQASYIGINMADVSSDVSKSYGIPTGVCIMNVVENSPAEAAGMKKGDVITKFDGRSVSNAQGLKEILSYYASGETVEVTVQRADNGEYKEVVLNLTLGSASDAAGKVQSTQPQNGADGDGQITNPFGNR